MPKKYNQVWIDKILAMTKKGHRVQEIHTWLRNCGVPMSKRSVWYYAKGLQKPRQATRPKTTLEVRNLIRELTCENDEACAREIRRILKDRHDVEISESSIRRVRQHMGWRCRYGRPRMSLMIRDGSKVRRKVQAKARIEKNQLFNDVIVTGETSATCLPNGTSTDEMEATTNKKVLVRKENLTNSASKRKAKAKPGPLHSTGLSLLETPEDTARGAAVTEGPVSHGHLLHGTEEVLSDDGPSQPVLPIAPHIRTGHRLRSGRNLLAGDEVRTDVRPSTNQNMSSAPDKSHHGPNFNPSAIILPSQRFVTCRCGAQERLERIETELKEIKKTLSSMSQVVEDSVGRAMSSVNHAVEKALSTMSLVVPHNVSTDGCSPPLLETTQSHHVPSVKEEPEDYVNGPITSASENGPPNAAVSTFPPTVVAPVSDFTLPVLDSSMLDGLHEAARSEPHRFAQLLFQELVPYDVYKTWTRTVNYDGSRGKRPLPGNLRKAIVQETQKYYLITTEMGKKIKDTLNAFLRMPRASRW